MAARKPTAKDIADLIDWIANGEEDPHRRSIRNGCEKFGLHRGDVHAALMTDEWANQSARAREMRGNEIGEMAFGVFDDLRSGDLDPKAAAVMHDILKRASGAMAPKTWGAKSSLDVTSDGKALAIAVVSEHAKDV